MKLSKTQLLKLLWKLPDGNRENVKYRFHDFTGEFPSSSMMSKTKKAVKNERVNNI